ncbi:unnamed protein product [Nezara viridula]|uniref:Uncharacterized protein n=1 Tax=Nezara viridula TaxID=85310 RepID=A0A9P0E8L2_NEZVI|nr:unnamed protein product [Nezara viridula]
MACTITACQAIFHGKCLNADESEFEALRALRKHWVCPKCEKARKNIKPTDKCLSPPRSAPQQQTVDSTSQLLLAAIKSLTEEVKGLKFSLDANANELTLMLLKDMKANPAIQNYAGATPYGVSRGRTGIIMALLAYGASPEIDDESEDEDDDESDDFQIYGFKDLHINGVVNATA